jgi:hypothetical protein
MGNRVSPFYGLFAIAVGALLATAASAADQPKSSSPQPVLHLANGGSVPGEIRASTQPSVLRWHPASSGSRSEFAWTEVNAIEWPPPAAQPERTGDFCFELAAGDVLFGSLLALDDERAELDVPRLGRIHVQRSNVHRVDRWRAGADLGYLGPNGLAGCQELARGLGPTDHRPQRCVDLGQFRGPRSRQHRVRDLLADQARLRAGARNKP